METAIKKAIEGGFDDRTHYDACSVNYPKHRVVCEPLFWQALGKACGYDTRSTWWKNTALKFYRTNLTEGWTQAVEYLLSVIESK